MDAQGLFGSGAAGAAPDAASAADGRRTKLFGYDSVAAQLLEPYGKSALGDMELPELWDATKKGNRKAAYHSHLCANLTTDAWHVGAGISVTAAALLHAVEALEHENLKRILKEDLYAAAMGEAKTLKPHLEVLNFGKGIAGQGPVQASFRAVKKRRVDPSAPAPGRSEPEVQKAAEQLHDWLSKPSSPLRGLLFILSANNVFFTGYAAEKVARACVKHKPASKEDFVTGALARARTVAAPGESTGAAGSQDASGLFGTAA